MYSYKDIPATMRNDELDHARFEAMKHGDTEAYDRLVTEVLFRFSQYVANGTLNPGDTLRSIVPPEIYDEICQAQIEGELDD